MNASHCHHWSVAACAGSCVTTGSTVTSVVVPVKVTPPSFETLSTMVLLQPAVLTLSYRFRPNGENPAEWHVAASCWLMYEPNVTTTWFGAVGLTAPDG